MKHLRLWCRNESCLQPGAEEKLVPTVSWNTSSPRILSRWRCLPSRYCFSRALALGKVPQCPQATGLQSNHRKLAWHQVSPPLSLWHLKTQYAHHQHYILISQGLFLSVLPKTQFPKNAKTQFENTKTQFENPKTQFENPKTQFGNCKTLKNWQFYASHQNKFNSPNQF